MNPLPIVDAHVHFWDPQLLSYPWLTNVPLLNKPYLVDDYSDATAMFNIAKVVFVQCECSPGQSEDEVKWVKKLAAADKRIGGIVAWAPLELGNAALPVLTRFSENNLVKGIRRIIQYEEDQNFCLTDHFIEGLKLLPKFNLCFDICVAYHQLPQVIQMVNLCPEIQFVLDHVGKPDIANSEFTIWAENIATLSKFSNVSCKLSGLVTEADHRRWVIEDIIPYVEVALKCFGTNRLMFGGDWPVLCQASSYQRWVDTVDFMLDGLTERQKSAVFYDNAVRFYRLK